jgi:hypothetical protein
MSEKQTTLTVSRTNSIVLEPGGTLSSGVIEYVRNLDILLDEGLLLEECSNMLHCLVSHTGMSNSPFNRRIHLRYIRRSGIQPPLRRRCVCKYRHEWLVQFVSDRARKFSDGRQSRSLCEFDTRVAKMVFCSFPLIDVNREAIPLNDLPARITQRCRWRTAGPVAGESVASVLPCMTGMIGSVFRCV